MELLPVIDSQPAPITQDGDPQHCRGRYAFISLGCPKNLVDSERMLGLLQLDGYQLVDDPRGADFVVVNTCGFIEEARTESFGAIDEMLQLKQQGQTKGVIVSGCLAERQKEVLLQERPQIDALVGVFGREEITKVADRLVGNLHEQRTVFRPAPIQALRDHDRMRITPRHFAYLKISEGCDRLCTFCAIPKMRGKHVSKPIEEVLSEAQQLSQSGVRELIVVAQDTTYYGKDLYGRPRLAELLRRLDEVEGLDWIRLMYFYPMYIDDELIETIASSSRIIPYLDLPLQHIHDEVLRRMARRVSREQTEELLSRLREGIPGLTLRTTFITGFPGETEKQFQELVDFVRRQKFERMGVFTYSLETDTPAARLDGLVSEKIAETRRDRLMRIQRNITIRRQKARLGRREDVILDRPLPGEEGVAAGGPWGQESSGDDCVWIGRTMADAPDVDAVVYVTAGEDGLQAGDIVRCEFVAQQDYDLVAAAVGKPR